MIPDDVSEGDIVVIDGVEHTVVGVKRVKKPTGPERLVSVGVKADDDLAASTIIPAGNGYAMIDPGDDAERVADDAVAWR